MNAALDPAVSRFTVLQRDDEEKAGLWRGKVQAFRNLYAFLSQVIPYQDSDLERLYVFLRHLATKLPRRRGGPTYQLDDDVRLEYYRLQKISEGSISRSSRFRSISSRGVRATKAVMPSAVARQISRSTSRSSSVSSTSLRSRAAFRRCGP